MTSLLILDDESRQQRRFREAAVQAGFREESVISATSVAEAIESLDKQIDVALIDMRIKGDLYDAAITFIRTLKVKQPACQIIGFSRTRVEQESQARTYGACDFLTDKVSDNWYDLLIEKLKFYRELAEAAAAPLT